MNSCKSKHHHDKECCFTCCERKQQVQDELCCEFTVTALGTPLFGTDQLNCGNLVISGTIKNCDTAFNLLLDIRESGLTLQDITFPPGGCYSFIFSRVNRIFGTSGSPIFPVKGEIGLTARYNN